ncbi:hypothetical protein ACLKA6_001894 [Drosophila palustris]
MKPLLKLATALGPDWGAKGAIIFSCEVETTFKAIEDLAQDQGLRSMSGRPSSQAKTHCVCLWSASLHKHQLGRGKIKALASSPLNVTNIVGNISGRPTSKFRVELITMRTTRFETGYPSSFEVTIDQCFRCRVIYYYRLRPELFSFNFISMFVRK